MELRYYLVILFTLLIYTGKAQNKRIINPDEFNSGYFSSVLLSYVNDYRKSEGNEALESHKILDKAAYDQAYYMAENQEETLKNKGEKKTTADRVILYGGTHRVEELTGREKIRKGKYYLTYEDVAKEIADDWIKKKKTEPTLNNPKYVFAGLSPVIDFDGNYVYVSIVLGNYNSFNSGAKMKDYLDVPFTTKKYRLKNIDKKECRNCQKFEDIENLHKSLYVKDGLIYFRYSKDYRAFKRLLRDKKDGIAVDIVQKSQYNCDFDDNIVDYNLLNKGYLLKPVYSNKIFKSNLDKSKRPKEFHFVVGEFPEEIKGDYELNLLLIQDRHVCRTIFQSYTDITETDFFHPLQLVPDTVTIKTDKEYVVIPDTTFLFFRIPFEQGKSTYKPSDIQPFIEALHEPVFSVLEAQIIAVSSLEGSEEININLQLQRAESIADALRKMHKEALISDIRTNNSWDLFRADVMDTKYSKIAEMDYEAAREYIHKKGLVKELEPIFKNHRFAEITLKVVYDISGDNEQYFVVDKFNKTLQAKDIPFAFSMQKHIIDKAVLDIYQRDAIEKMEVPDGKQYAPFQVNKLFLEQLSTTNKLEPDFCDKIYTLHEYAPDNPYILFNKLCCDVRNKVYTKSQDIKEIQSLITQFYQLDIPRDYIDNLNLNFQFKTIKYTDTLEEPTQTASNAFDIIKKLVNIEESSMTNSLALAKLFIKYNDYQFAGRLLDKYIQDPDINEDYVFTYLSVCSHVPAKIMTKHFATAQEKASELNKKRYCSLFDGDKFSFQVFDNPSVKSSYCKTCNSLNEK